VLNIPKKSKVRERHEFIYFAKNLEILSLRLTNCKPQVFDIPHRRQGLSDTMLVRPHLKTLLSRIYTVLTNHPELALTTTCSLPHLQHFAPTHGVPSTVQPHDYLVLHRTFNSAAIFPNFYPTDIASNGSDYFPRKALQV
jgi:hypothetical protein